MAGGGSEACFLTLEPMLFTIPQAISQSLEARFTIFSYCKERYYIHVNRQRSLIASKETDSTNLNQREFVRREWGSSENVRKHIRLRLAPHWSQSSSELLDQIDDLVYLDQIDDLVYLDQIDTATVGWRVLYICFCSCKSQGERPTGLAWVPYPVVDSVDGPSKTTHIWEAEISQKEIRQTSSPGRRTDAV